MAVTYTPRPAAGLIAGIAAGLVASAAMSAFQAAATKLSSDDSGGGDDEGDPATVKAADLVTRAATGEKVPEPYRDLSGEVVHYVVGAAMGGFYGWLAEYRPMASAGFGSAYGLATSALFDEAAVPALGLSDAPWEQPLTTHAYGVASHLVFGVTLEATRWLLGGRKD